MWRRAILVLLIHVCDAKRCSSVSQPSAEERSLWHLHKYRAYGKSLEEYEQNVERNRVANVTGFLETAESNGDLGPDVASSTFCPSNWMDSVSPSGRFLGGGAYGKVYLVFVTCDEFETPIAVKKQDSTDTANKEASLMLSFKHANVVKAFDSYKEGSTSYLLMEVASGGSFENIKKYNDPTKARLFYEMCLGVSHIHSFGWTHGDLKHDNVFLSDDCAKGPCFAKVGDLGLACNTKDPNDCKGTGGTPLYVSPEMIATNHRGQSDDLWAAGVMLYEIFFRSAPAFLNDPGTGQPCTTIPALNGVLLKLFKASFEYRIQSQSSELDTLLGGLLQAKSAGRLTTKGMVDAARDWATAQNNQQVAAAPTPWVPSCWKKCSELNCFPNRCVNGACTIASQQHQHIEETTIAPSIYRLVTHVIIRINMDPFGLVLQNDGLIVEVHGLAKHAQIHPGDIVVSLNNQPYATLSQYTKDYILGTATRVMIEVLQKK